MSCAATAVFYFVVYTTCILYSLRLAASQDVPYELIVNRLDTATTGPLIDTVTLSCRDSMSGVLLLPDDEDVGLRFWRNRQGADDPGISSDDYRLSRAPDGTENGGIRFQLTRQLEGNYTCGTMVDAANVRESSRKTLITLQTNFERLLLNFDAVTTYFVAAGSQVTLSCPVQPGNLYQFYFGRWMRNYTTLIERAEDPNAPDISLRGDMESFELDPRTFALTIKSANVTHDASKAYRCVLMRYNPESQAIQEFTQAAFIEISLMVNEKPTIVEGPKPFLVTLGEAQTTHRPTFTCVVGGAPKPTLVWTYLPNINDDVMILLEDGEDYSVTFNVTGEASGRFLVTSTITFLSIRGTDGGIVRCRTGLNEGTAVTADALLIVLGVADNFNVFESRSNDIIYELTYPAELLHPVTLNITYTSPNGAPPHSRIPDVSYNNTKTITYKEVRSELPYSMFHVSFALVALNGSERISGPSTPESRLIDINRHDPIIITSVTCVAVVILVVFTTVLVAVVLLYKYKSKSKSIDSIQKTMKDLPEKFLDRLSPEKREEFLNNLIDKYNRRIQADSGIGNEEENSVKEFNRLMWDSYLKSPEYKNRQSKIPKTVTPASAPSRSLSIKSEGNATDIGLIIPERCGTVESDFGVPTHKEIEPKESSV